MPLNEEFWKEEEDALWAVLVALYIETLMQGVDGGTDILPPELQPLVDVDKINANAVAQSADFKRGVLDNIHATTRRQVEDAVAKWEETGGGDMNVLSAMLSPIFSDARAEMIAVTETTRAFDAGNRMAWAATGYISFHQWNTQKDERVCPICGPKDGKVYHLTGEKPPAHPRCRCWVSPVVRLV